MTLSKLARFLLISVTSLDIVEEWVQNKAWVKKQGGSRRVGGRRYLLPPDPGPCLRRRQLDQRHQARRRGHQGEAGVLVSRLPGQGSRHRCHGVILKTTTTSKQKTLAP